MAKTQPHPDQLTLNLSAGLSVVTVRHADGSVLLKPGRIIVRGTTRDVARALGVDVDTALRLRTDPDTGIVSWKPRAKRNSKIVWDMSTVYAYRQRREDEE